jgi:DNA invertase Pin-like site-specific DNA recombinase
MLYSLATGDVVTETRIDRLAHPTFDLFAIVKRIVDATAQFRSLAEPWTDTSTSTGRMMMAVLGSRADVERDLIRAAPATGRKRANARGEAWPRSEAGRPPEARKRFVGAIGLGLKLAVRSDVADAHGAAARREPRLYNRCRPYSRSPAEAELLATADRRSE